MRGLPLSQQHTWWFYTPIVTISEITRSARFSDCDFRWLPQSTYKIPDIWNVRYWQSNSLAFAKCARSRDFLRSLLQISSKANPSGWAILPLTLLFKTATLPRLAKKIGKCVHINRWRKSLTIFTGDQICCNRHIKSPGVLLALHSHFFFLVTLYKAGEFTPPVCYIVGLRESKAVFFLVSGSRQLFYQFPKSKCNNAVKSGNRAANNFYKDLF